MKGISPLKTPTTDFLKETFVQLICSQNQVGTHTWFLMQYTIPNRDNEFTIFHYNCIKYHQFWSAFAYAHQFWTVFLSISDIIQLVI